MWAYGGTFSDAWFHMVTHTRLPPSGSLGLQASDTSPGSNSSNNDEDNYDGNNNSM